MFSYFGSKSKLVKNYPAPKHSKIIEPFAGSARYALEYWDREVELWDINPMIFSVWQYLLNASEQDIRSLPTLEVGDHIDNFNLTDPEKWLVGFELCRGKSVPRKVVSKFSDWPSARERIASNIHKIKHWKINLGAYTDVDNKEATWFIDPPYILDDETGMSYPYGHKQMDYKALAKWCKERQGQVIVCAGTNDYWLPFQTLREVWNGRKRGLEKIYTQENA